MKPGGEGSVITITPIEMAIRLRIDPARERDPGVVKSIVLRWLERAARRQGRFLNEPSLMLHVEREAAIRQTFLYAFADSVPESMPDWLRTTIVVIPAEVCIK